MKALLLALVALSSANAFADCATIQKEFLARAKSAFDVGEVSRTAVAKAELRVLNAQKICSEIAQEKYCAEAAASAEVYYLGIREESRVGQASDDDVLKASLTRQAIRNACK